MAKIIIETENLEEGQALLDALAVFASTTADVTPIDEAPAQVATATQDAIPQGMTPVAPDVAQTPPLAYVPEIPANDEIDVNGMVWNGAYHAKTKTKKDDGSWTVQRGKSKEAKAALDAHKASGHGADGHLVTPISVMQDAVQPTSAPAAAPVAPVAPAAPVAAPAPAMQPAAPAAAPVDMVPPVTQAMLEAKITDMFTRQLIDGEGYGKLLDAIGVPRADPTTMLSTNESLRAKLYNDCLLIEQAG